MSVPDLDARLRSQLHRIAEEHADLELQLADPEVLADADRLRVASKRYNELGPVVEAVSRHAARRGDALAAEELIDASDADADAEERALVQQELDEALRELPELEGQLRELLVPKDPNDGRNVIIEIRGAEGGEEANLFARDLAEMYEAFAARKGLRIETLSAASSDKGGFDNVTFLVSGDDAWRHLKYEGGPHRVQRVPVTESQGRIHTSSATVTVLPEVDDVEVDVRDADLDVDVYRSSGAGGQHVNTTDSAVRITHRPTGIVVTMQDERSQLQNRQRAMQVLRARLHELAVAERDASMSAERRSQTGGGGRSEKIRTYNFKENRVTDHRIGLTIYRLADVLGGDLDQVVGPLAAEERARLLAEGDADD
ncbi:MAG: peptide chain release factor 1 [Actinomycetota bacterium]